MTHAERKSSLCDYSDSYILESRTITFVRAGKNDAAGATNRNNKEAIFKNCAPVTNSITETNNTQVDNAKDIDVVMPMYNLIEYSHKTSGSLCQLQT